MKIKNTTLLLLSITVTEGAGIIGSFFTVPAIPTWYATIAKPSFNPPNWIFAPVWTLLFFLMGISLYLVWTSAKREKAHALNVFWIHLAVNILWSLFFFGLRSPILGFIDILILLSLIAYTMQLFERINRWAMYLLIPYFLWTTCATVLNLAIVFLN